MAYHPNYNDCYRCDSGYERHSSRPRATHGDYALVPLNHSHRADRPLRDYIADENALDSACILRPARIFGGGGDSGAIDREGPYRYHPHSPRCRNVPHTCDDEDYLDQPDPNWRFSYTYPLACMETGRVRWGPDQIRAYNRDVLRHNNQIARRKAAGVAGENMMLHPMMDPHGRFPPGFDRPVGVEDFFRLEEPLIDSHRQHYGLPPPPENLERLLLLNSAEQNLRRELKRIQLLEYYGARRLAEQFGMQLLAAQNALPGLSMPRLGYGLGPDFDDSYLSPLRRNYGGTNPVEAAGYGSGLANWNPNVLRGMLGDGAANPWARAGMYPGMMNRGNNVPSSWPGLSYGGGGYGGQNDIQDVLNRVGYDGGSGRRNGRFN